LAADQRILVAACCGAEILAMAGNMAYPALIPVFIDEWQLTHTEAGWIGGVAYGAYTAAVPVLVTLTDRIDARRIVIAFTLVSALSSLGFALFADGFWSALLFRALNGLALGGTYMPGLKALTDRLEGPRKSRYQSFYTASFSVGTSLSLLLAGLVAQAFGWRIAFVVAGVLPLLALPLLLGLVPPKAPLRRPAKDDALLDFRPVLRNREAMGYVLGYAAHCWELFAFRNWLVAFMTFVAGIAGGVDRAAVTGAATVILLLGLPASVLGNELALRHGRRRVLIVLMSVSVVLALATPMAALLPLWLALALLALYAFVLMTDSASLTVGTVNAAEAERRGSTIAIHTTLGSAAAFVAPLVSGLVLESTGGGVTIGSWLACFAVFGAGVALGPLALLALVPASTAKTGSVGR
jgi:MFS family permease